MHFILIHLHIPPSLGSQTFLCHCLCLIKYKSFEKLAGKTMNPLSNECDTLIVATGQFGLVTFGNADSVDVRSEMSVRYECVSTHMNACLFSHFPVPYFLHFSPVCILVQCAKQQATFPWTCSIHVISSEETGEGQEGAAEGTSCWQDTAVALAAGWIDEDVSA